MSFFVSTLVSTRGLRNVEVSVFTRENWVQFPDREWQVAHKVVSFSFLKKKRTYILLHCQLYSQMSVIVHLQLNSSYFSVRHFQNEIKNRSIYIYTSTSVQRTPLLVRWLCAHLSCIRFGAVDHAGCRGLDSKSSTLKQSQCEI